MQYFRRTFLQARPVTKAQNDRQRRMAEIEAAVIRMKLRKEGRLK